MAKRNHCHYETEAMEESIECAFQSMVDRKDFAEALEFINACYNKVPHYSVMRTIIFKIIMDKDCDKKIVMEAATYLNRILTIYSPSDKNRRIYYKSALINGKNTFLDMWAAFSHLVESSFCHHKIYRVTDDDDQMKPVQHPHCDILIDFYVKVLLESYEHLSSERTFYENREKSLVAELFWPSQSSEFSAAKENPCVFLKWMNSIYARTSVQKVNVFRSLHKLLNAMVKCIIDTVYNWSDNDRGNKEPDSLICNSACLLDIVKVIMCTCGDAFLSHATLRRFVNHITLKYLRIKLCEYRLYELIYSRQPSERNLSPYTLKDIVDIYMFPMNFSKRKKATAVKEKQIIKEKPKIIIKMNRKGDTDLHNACRLDKPADLYELLSAIPAPDINAKNCVGYTPLHVASISNSHLCAKVLIDYCSAENSNLKLDWAITDEDGLTSLHIAIQKDACSIAKMILKHGGAELLNCVDNSGFKPHQYASSKEMEKLLKEFVTEANSKMDDTSLDSVFTRNIPVLSNYKEYALFFHALQFLLAYYSDIFHLFEVRTLLKRDKSSVEPQNHEGKLCPHFRSCGVNVVCSIDFLYFKQLPEIVNHFIKCAIECTEEMGLKMDLELLPLKMYVATLNV